MTDIFETLGGEIVDGFPAIHSRVSATDAGTSYLNHAGVAMIAKPQTNLNTMRGFLQGFQSDLSFEGYLDDPTELTPGAQLLKSAGQACYASFGPKRSYNSDAGKYFGNLASAGHGSVFEHASFSFLCYGISRSNTHEVIRHRAGAAYSQLSQRFVSGAVLRFVERPEFRASPSLHKRFCERIDAAAREYDDVADELSSMQEEGSLVVSAERKTDARKRVRQAARAVLPNETETFLVMTANVRAWRHIIEMRTDAHAEIEIRDLFFRIYACLSKAEPLLFEDYEVTELPDGSFSASTSWRKI